MKTLNLIQGDANWHAHRAASKNASDAPAMLGCSEYKTRSELLHEAFTGIRPDVTPEQQRRFDDGHAIEEAQLPGAEEVIGEQLYPVVGCERFGDIELSASFDGLTLLEDTAYECKTLNEKLRATLPAPGPDGNDATALPKMYRAQMEQQLMVCGGDRVLFTAATKDGSDVRRCWYSSDAALRAEILAGWKQFDADLKTYVPAAAVEKVVAEPVEALPAPVVQVTGQIALQDNFKVFEQRLRDFLENKLIRKPTTDQDFADLDGQIKAMKSARESLKAAEAQMLAQVQPVDQAKKTKDMLDKLLQQNVKMAEDMLTAEKDRRKGEIVAGGVAALKAHIEALNTRLGEPFMPVIPADFGGAVRGLKSLTSMEDKVSGELARCKIAANEVADRIQVNMKKLVQAGDSASFHDSAALVLKAPDDLTAIIAQRIAETERRAEAARAAIRAEEQAKAEKDAREKLAAEQAEAKRLADEAAALNSQIQASIKDADPDDAIAPLLGEISKVAHELSSDLIASAAIKTAQVLPLSRPAAPQADTSPRIKLGDLNATITPLSITADGLALLGFPHEPSTGSAKLYRMDDLPEIYAAMVRHIEAVQAKAAA